MTLHPVAWPRLSNGLIKLQFVVVCDWSTHYLLPTASAPPISLRGFAFNLFASLSNCPRFGMAKQPFLSPTIVHGHRLIGCPECSPGEATDENATGTNRLRPNHMCLLCNISSPSGAYFSGFRPHPKKGVLQLHAFVVCLGH